MFNSYFGLERAVCIPPNIKMLGPINKEPSELMEILKEKDMKLYEWLEEAKTSQTPVIYISLGSIVELQAWSVNAIYDGLKNLGYKVIWSLNDKWRPLLKEDPDKDPNFWVSGWLPQIEVLNHDAVLCGLTHCGWGGLIEFVSAGKPVVTFPHFADQTDNSVMIC